MDIKTRRDLAQRLQSYLNDGTTALSETEYVRATSDYACPQHLAQERDALFLNNPILIGLSCQLPKPGDYLTENYTGTPLLFVRQNDGSLAGFINACRHRGAPVAEGSGACGGRFTCPFHAWRYDINGALAHIPGEDGFAGIDRAELGLLPIAVFEKDGLIWAIPNPERADEKIDIDGFLHGLGDEFASYSFNNYHYLDAKIIHPNINWKLGIEGFLETYHLGPLHKATIGPFFLTNINTSDSFGLHHRMVGLRRSISAVADNDEFTENFLDHTVVIYTLAPNTIFIYQRDHLETWRLFPDMKDPGKCIMVFSFYIPEPIADESDRRHWDKNFQIALNTVVTEDLALSEQIQKGFESRAQKTVIVGRNEPAISNFHASLEEMQG